MTDRLYYISQATASLSHIMAIEQALEAGCRLVQLRIKNSTAAAVLPEAVKAKALCDRYNAQLIINDYPEVALAVKAYGVHIGLTDMPVREARALVGSSLVIGGTANTFADIVRRVEEGVDYIGLGPYRFTTTKEKLSPVLGLAGYRQLLQQMRAAGMQLPVIAIGGILPGDIPGLLEAGVHGVAVSGVVTNAVDKKAIVSDLLKLLQLVPHLPIINDESMSLPQG